jgi:uncharacterized membrane protein required for colicin V production
MIAVVTETHQPYSLDHLPFNWFDALLVVMLVFGLFRGRKNGMSKEWFPLLEWVLALGAATFFYPRITEFLINVVNMKRTATPYVLAYVSVVLLVFFIFYFIKHSLKADVGGSNFFGGGEYYLGMFSGIIRYACIATFFLAILHAPVYTKKDIADIKSYNKRNFGGGLYEGNYLPDISSTQQSVFQESFLGPFIDKYCGVILIQTDDSGGLKPPVKTSVAGAN